MSKSEAAVQQAVRMAIAEAGGVMWRNNVGVTPSKCESCKAPLRPIRYGLANDSKRLNERFKSSDLIGIVPMTITPDMVGQRVGVFTAIETKRESWEYSGTAREQAQAGFINLVRTHGGQGYFSKGGIYLP